MSLAHLSAATCAWKLQSTDVWSVHRQPASRLPTAKLYILGPKLMRHHRHDCFQYSHPYFVIRRLVTLLTKKRNQFVDSQVTAAVLVRFTKELFVLARHFYRCQRVSSTANVCVLFTSTELWQLTANRSLWTGALADSLTAPTTAWLHPRELHAMAVINW